MSTCAHAYLTTSLSGLTQTQNWLKVFCPQPHIPPQTRSFVCVSISVNDIVYLGCQTNVYRWQLVSLSLPFPHRLAYQQTLWIHLQNLSPAHPLIPAPLLWPDSELLSPLLWTTVVACLLHLRIDSGLCPFCSPNYNQIKTQTGPISHFVCCYDWQLQTLQKTFRKAIGQGKLIKNLLAWLSRGQHCPEWASVGSRNQGLETPVYRLQVCALRWLKVGLSRQTGWDIVHHVTVWGW